MYIRPYSKTRYYAYCTCLPNLNVTSALDILLLFVIRFNSSNIYALLYGSQAFGNSSVHPNLGNWVGDFVQILVFFTLLSRTSNLSCTIYFVQFANFIFIFIAKCYFLVYSIFVKFDTFIFFVFIFIMHY